MLKYLIFVLLTSTTSFALNELNIKSDGDRLCQPHRWYSIGPCQLCYCLSDQSLKCNQGYAELTDIPLGSDSDQLYACGDLSDDVKQVQTDPLRVMRHRMDNSGSSEEDRGLSIYRSKADKPKICKADDDDKEDDSVGENTKLDKKQADSTTNINMKVKHHMEINEKFDVDFNLPESLMNLIQTGMRKSMLTVKPGNDCVPGTQYLEDSLCFCMNNGKLLCRKGSAAPNAGSHS